MPQAGNRGDGDQYARAGIQTLVAVAGKNYDGGRSRGAVRNVHDYAIWEAIHVIMGEDMKRALQKKGLGERINGKYRWSIVRELPS